MGLIDVLLAVIAFDIIIYTVSKNNTLDLHQNLGKCRPIYIILSLLSNSDNGEVILCINFAEFVIKSYSERSCIICILCFIYCTKIQ